MFYRELLNTFFTKHNRPYSPEHPVQLEHHQLRYRGLYLPVRNDITHWTMEHPPSDGKMHLRPMHRHSLSPENHACAKIISLLQHAALPHSSVHQHNPADSKFCEWTGCIQLPEMNNELAIYSLNQIFWGTSKQRQHVAITVGMGTYQ